MNGLKVSSGLLVRTGSTSCPHTDNPRIPRHPLHVRPWGLLKNVTTPTACAVCQARHQQPLL